MSREFIKKNCYNLNDAEFIFNYKKNDETGKDSVISQFKSIVNNPSYLKKLKDYIFIVDHDYDGVRSFNYKIEDNEHKKITITKTYSFENYFLTEENVKKIFIHFNLTDIDRLKFEEKYNKFIEDINEYIKLKSSTIIVKKIGHKYYDSNASIYKKIYKYEEIFQFDFRDEFYYFCKEKMYEENENMKRYLNKENNNKALDFYLKESEKYAKREFVRGHDAYNFLKSYLEQIHNINCKDEFFEKKHTYAELVNQLNVDIEIKNALGETLN